MPVFLLFGSCPVLPMGHQCLMAIYKRHSTKYNKYITALCPCRWCQTSRKLALASPFSRVILDSKCVGVKVFLKLRKLSDFTPVISQVYLKTTNLYILLYIYILQSILKSFPSPLDLTQALPSVGAQVGLNPEVWKSQTLWIYSLERVTFSLRINGVRWNFLNGPFYSQGNWRMEPKNEGLI